MQTRFLQGEIVADRYKVYSRYQPRWFADTSIETFLGYAIRDDGGKAPSGEIEYMVEFPVNHRWSSGEQLERAHEYCAFLNRQWEAMEKAKLEVKL